MLAQLIQQSRIELGEVVDHQQNVEGLDSTEGFNPPGPESTDSPGSMERLDSSGSMERLTDPDRLERLDNPGSTEGLTNPATMEGRLDSHGNLEGQTPQDY